jgi:guanylate kinase
MSLTYCKRSAYGGSRLVSKLLSIFWAVRFTCCFKAIVMVGLDGSGKTSILRQLIDQKPGILRPTISTIGMSSLENFLIRSSG